MTLKRMDNVLIVVDDLEAVKAFFIELGLMFLVNYGVAELIKPRALRLDLQWPLMEIKECLFSVLFVLIALYFVTTQSQRDVAAAPATAPAAPATGAFADDDEEFTPRPA